MTIGYEIRLLLLSLRPVDMARLDQSSSDSEQFFRLWKNVTSLAHFAQVIADPHDSSENAKLCRDVIRCCAECKLTLTELSVRRMTGKQAELTFSRLAKQYNAVKIAMTKYGEITDPFWGQTVPNLLVI